MFQLEAWIGKTSNRARKSHIKNIRVVFCMPKTLHGVLYLFIPDSLIFHILNYTFSIALIIYYPPFTIALTNYFYIALITVHLYSIFIYFTSFIKLLLVFMYLLLVKHLKRSSNYSVCMCVKLYKSFFCLHMYKSFFLFVNKKYSIYQVWSIVALVYKNIQVALL